MAICASKKSSQSVNPKSFALWIPSTRILTISFCNFTTCLTSAMIPTSNNSSCLGESCSISLCATKKSFCSPIIACSTAFRERERLISKCATIPGKIAIPLRATAGIINALSSTLLSYEAILNYEAISSSVESFTSNLRGVSPSIARFSSTISFVMTHLVMLSSDGIRYI